MKDIWLIEKADHPSDNKWLVCESKQEMQLNSEVGDFCYFVAAEKVEFLGEIKKVMQK